MLYNISMKKIFRILVLLVLIVCVSCATAETSSETSKTNTAKAETMQAEPWLYPSAMSMSAAQWNELFKKEEPVIEEPKEELIEEIPEEVTETLEEEVGEEIVIEEVIEEPVEESSIKILEDEKEEETTQEEEQIVLPEMEWNFAGEDYRSLSWLLEEEPAVETEEIQDIEKSAVVEQGDWVEEMNPDLITEMAKEYKALEEVDIAQPSFKEKALSFFKNNLLYFELGGLLIVFLIVLKMLVSKAKKRHAEAQVVPEEDEGVEVNMTPGYYESPNRVPQSYKDEIGDDSKEESKEKPIETPVEDEEDEEDSEEESSEERHYEYDDGF